MRNFFLLLTSVALSSYCFAEDSKIYSMQFAEGKYVPKEKAKEWKEIPEKGIDIDGDEFSRYWVRVKPNEQTTRWVIYGPLNVGDSILIENKETLEKIYITDNKYGNEKGWKPRIKIGRGRAKFGPIVVDLPKVPKPKIDITIGGGGGSSSEGTTVALKAGLENDPVRNSSDPQEAFCRTPIRAFNRESFEVAIHWTEKHTSSGPGCNNETFAQRNIILNGGQYRRVFCSHLTSPSSICSVNNSAAGITVKKN